MSPFLFKTADGVRSTPVILRRGPGAILFCHGNAGNISTGSFYRSAESNGMNVLIFDYRGYG